MTTNAPDNTIRFAEKILTLLDRGSFSSTYKYAVLLGLMDLCLEQSQKDGAPPAMVTTTQLAEKVIEFYWRQAVPFDVGQGVVLQQNTGNQAAIVGLIEGFRSRRGNDPGAGMHRCRIASPNSYDKLVSDVEWKLVEMPLPRVQQIGQHQDRFIYEIAWDESIRRGQWRDGSKFDNRIHFVGNAAEHLVQFAGLLRPLIQRQWGSMVAKMNRSAIQDSELDEFLFGASRVNLSGVKRPLRDLQGNRCFYCEEEFRDAIEVDHFMPWSRHPDNGLDNLVAAHTACNGSKSDHLAAASHVAKWSTRVETMDGQLDQLAGDIGWERDLGKTGGVIRGVYLRLPEQVRLWKKGNLFEESKAEILESILSA